MCLLQFPKGWGVGEETVSEVLSLTPLTTFFFCQAMCHMAVCDTWQSKGGWESDGLAFLGSMQSTKGKSIWELIVLD